MGWKLLKETFAITHHMKVVGDNVLIGSSYVGNLATINSKTGALTENETFPRFLRENYPALLKAEPATLAHLIATADTFEASIPVYTYDGGEIIERKCEVPGWPNATHDGEMMYENTHSTKKTEVVAWAKRNAHLAVRFTNEHIERLEKELADARASLARHTADVEKLAADYPDVAADTD
ncbi:hypothetical protein [Paraburkholderia sp. C35]|uniref:hypothetical protein n=1 Tax=Paraburkholderia sp. C35 TaxID=2126993 RepID=UPI000D691DC8|nr:hypothetical protein [Paraburkholderia sp. C35]